jgi:cytosine/adenosine deaminase-related metal-dependent hydrolase
MSLVLPDWLIVSADREPLAGHGLRVVDGTVQAIGPHRDLLDAHPTDTVHRAAGHAVLPGFVNSHVHLYGVLAHGIPVVSPPSGFESFLDEYWWPQVEDRLDQRMITTATEWVCAEMLRSGTTTFYDICEAPGALGGVLAAQAEVVRRMGLRGILSFEATERAGPDVARRSLEENRSFAASVADDPMIGAMMCWHTVFTCGADFITEAAGSAADLGIASHAHCNEGRHEGEWARRNLQMSTMAFYDSLGIAGPRLLASQCVQMEPEELSIIAERGVRVSHMPLSNCEVGGGIAPVPEMLAAGTTVGLGTDGYVNDMYEVMRGAFWMHKARLLDPSTMPASTVLAMATEWGAQALGVERVGRLEPGWSADLQVVSIDMATPVTAHNLVEQLLLWRNGGHVRDVMVAGQWRVRDGAVVDHDSQRVRARVHEEAARLWARST